MTLYLHIGYGKTATTTIQHFFRANATKLAENGIFWAERIWQERDPVSLQPRQMRYGTTALPWCLSREVLSNFAGKNRLPSIGTFFKHALDSIDVDVEAFFQQLRSAKNRYNKIILSSEDFTSFPFSLFFPRMISKANHSALRDRFIALCKQYLSGFDDIKVVVSLRRQDQFIESAYNQVVAGPLCYSETIADYLRLQINALDYADNLRAWAECFGSENILVLPFEKSAMPRGPLLTFLEKIGCTPRSQNYEWLDAHVNYSASREVLASKLYFNRFVKDTLAYPEQEHIQALFDQRIQNEKLSGVCLLSSVERGRILQRFAQSNSETSKLFLGPEYGPLFKEGPEKEGAENVATDDLAFIHRQHLPNWSVVSADPIFATLPPVKQMRRRVRGRLVGLARRGAWWRSRV